MNQLKSVIVLNLIVSSLSWDLRSHAIGPYYYASSLSVFRNRAFLALPRSSCYNNLTNPTLIEVPWTGEQRNVIVRRKIEFPNADSQSWGSCHDLQDVISLDVETKWSRLWILDKGTKKCPAKIIAYNLILNIETDRYDLEGVDWKHLHTLVLDEENSRLFVSEDGQGGLIVFSINEGKWKRFTIKSSDSLYFLAVSTTGNLLYFSGKDSDKLFSINLEDLNNQKKTILNVTFIGHKLGPSSGLVADLKGGLTYFLQRDYAVVRWNTNKSLIAENHEVLSQSYVALPFITNFFIGPQNGVWALVNPSKPKDCEIKQRRGIPFDVPILKTRAVKMLNYVKRSRKSKISL